MRRSSAWRRSACTVHLQHRRMRRARAARPVSPQVCTPQAGVVNARSRRHARRVHDRPRKISASTWERLREAARVLGFFDLGAAPAMPLGAARGALRDGLRGTAGLDEWLAAGMHGDMTYMERTADKRQDPRGWWPDARTVLVGLVACDAPGEPGDPPEGATAEGSRGRVARYAWGRDHHQVDKTMLKALGRRLQREVPGSDWRCELDRGAAMEKPRAVLAGLGWIGKHSNFLRTDSSSWHVIGVLLTDAELDVFEPFRADHCGSCTACIDACPTGAIVAPQVVDARRCISHAT